MSTDSQINRQWQDDDLQPQQSSENYALSGRIMLASIIILFVVVVFLVLLHLYARWYLLRLRIRNVNRRRRSRSRTRIVFYVDNNRPPASIGALDASVLKSLPVFVYSPEINVNLPECAVCLSEFEPGEKGRVLPKCKHSFHTECIDMWFHSNSTCPLCRSPVEAVETEITEPGSSTSQVIETTTSCTDRTKRVDVRIDVPNRTELAAEIGLHLTSPSQGFRSPGSRLLALKRIISMGRKTPAVSPSSGVGPSCGPSVTESDLESGHESSRPGSVG